MKLNKMILVIVLIVVLSFFAFSQISSSNDDNKFTRITPASYINDRNILHEKEDCYYQFYNSTEPVYNYVARTRDIIGNCYNQANNSYYPCVNGTETYQSYEVVLYQTILRNNTICQKKSFIVENYQTGKKKEIDYSSWGVCVKDVEDGCVSITCGTMAGGSAFNGRFIGCDNGKACQKFLFCQDEVKVLYKDSRTSFVEEDPTYQLSKLQIKEVRE